MNEQAPALQAVKVSKDSLAMRGKAAKVETDLYQLLETGLLEPVEKLVETTTRLKVDFVQHCGMSSTCNYAESVRRSNLQKD